MSEPPLILLAEDEPLIALDLEAALIELGYRVSGPARSCAEALRLIASSPPNAAVLDVGLADGSCLPVALELERRGIGFILATAFEGTELDDRALLAAPKIVKPFPRETLMEMLGQMLERNGTERPLA